MKDNVKRIGDELLKHIRFVIHEVAQGDTTFEFKLRRWIYARLQIDERKTKNSIKAEKVKAKQRRLLFPKNIQNMSGWEKLLSRSEQM